jgi:hypothetical protein
MCSGTEYILRSIAGIPHVPADGIRRMLGEVMPIRNVGNFASYMICGALGDRAETRTDNQQVIGVCG